MEVQSPHKAKASELELILERWERRHEWRLLSRAVPRSLAIALGLSLVVGAVGVFRFRLDSEGLALLAGGFCALCVLINILYTLLFPRSLAERARYFDLEFGLREQVSTALEIMRGAIQTHPEIEARQISEALVQARAIDPAARIRMDFRPRELGLLALLAVAMLGVILLPALIGDELRPQPPSAALEEAREDLREIIETVAKDTSLPEIDRQELLESLEVALDRLQEQGISEEEAFAAMSQLQSQLEEAENELGETMELDQSSLQAALDALSDYVPQDESTDEAGENAGDALQELMDSLEQLSQDASRMSAEEAADAADALDAAAQETANMSEDLSDSLESMAEALEAGDRERLQESLEAAREQIAQESERRGREDMARTMLSEQAERAEDAAESIAREQSQAGPPQPGESQQSQSGQQRSGQPGDEQSDEAQSGARQGNRAADRNRQSPSQPGSPSQDSRASGAGAGSGEPSNQSLAGGGGEDQGAETNNQTSGMRQIEYEALYSPSGIDASAGEEIRLETAAGDDILAEGEFDDNPRGESRVSYDTVFGEYQSAANRALESDYVPLGLRDVVREYFTSLEPGSS